MRNKAEITRQIRWDWPDIVRNSHVKRAALDCLPEGRIQLFGSSIKTQLSAYRGVLTHVLYMSPARESGVEMCSRYATKACKALCLGHNSGMLSMTPSRRARLWKTALYHGDRGLFCALAECEIAALCNKAAKKHLAPAVRFDGSTDTGIATHFLNTFGHFYPELHFYDYTKDAQRAHKYLGHATYDVTLSYTGENWRECGRFLARGGRVAVVFDVQKGAELPDSIDGWPVIDGDQHDATWLHAPGVVLGLRLKAAARRQAMRKYGIRHRFVVTRGAFPGF